MQQLNSVINTASESLNLAYVPTSTESAIYAFGVLLIMIVAWRVVFCGSISETLDKIRSFFSRYSNKPRR